MKNFKKEFLMCKKSFYLFLFIYLFLEVWFGKFLSDALMLNSCKILKKLLYLSLKYLNSLSKWKI